MLYRLSVILLGTVCSAVGISSCCYSVENPLCFSVGIIAPEHALVTTAFGCQVFLVGALTGSEFTFVSGRLDIVSYGLEMSTSLSERCSFN